MKARIVLLIVCALWGWDVATPVQPLAQTIVWDEEEEVSRPGTSRIARPSAADGDVLPAQPAPRATIRRVVHVIARSRSAQHAPVHAPRARIDPALVDSPTEDH